MFASAYAKCYQKLNKNKPYENEIQFVHQWAGRPKRILDIGCGNADYWKHYPLNTEIYGIEKSPYMIEQSRFKSNILCLEANRSAMENWIKPFDCVTALFDVINYIPNHTWWKYMPLKQGGYFIFDIWDMDKIRSTGFIETIRRVGDITRVITPIKHTENKVELELTIRNGDKEEVEIHTMYLHSREDIKRFCGKHFVIDEIKPTKGWQTWFRLKMKDERSSVDEDTQIAS